MQIITSPAALREITDLKRLENISIGFVPTMGALHEGHLTLVDEAKKHASFIIVSIFVNPTQFGPGEDFEKYYRNLKLDAEKLEQRGADLIFAPSVKDMYGKNNFTTVSVKNITKGLCGQFRPGHFDGVATVVSKLFNITGPCSAIFGKKDYQQLIVIKQMVNDLNIPVNIIGVPTIREPDGLAMSSRNSYLSREDRKKALCLSRAIKKADSLFNNKALFTLIKSTVYDIINKNVDYIEYIDLYDPETLETFNYNIKQPMPKKILLAMAVKIGTTRLIDNIVLGEDIINF